MATLTLQHLPDDIHCALRVRAAQHGHSIEAEVRAILALAVKVDLPVRVGDTLAATGRKMRLTNDDVALMEHVRDRTPADPFMFT